MTEQSKQQFDDLYRAWKNTRAPASLVPKIMASVEDKPAPFRGWDLRWSAMAAVIIIAVVIGMTDRHSGEFAKPVINLSAPSLATINQAAGGKPHFSIPGIGNVKSVPMLPKIPPSPSPTPREPTSSIHQEYYNEISHQNRIA